MASERPPTIDPVAAERWQRRAPMRSPWLHEEVARRMEDRLQWIRLTPRVWAHWEPLRGGLGGHELLTRRYPGAECLLVEPLPERSQALREQLEPPWWRRWRKAPAQHLSALPDQSVQMLWSNMALHSAPDPQVLLAGWHRALATDGFLMFSCLGPDTLLELRELYRNEGWPAPGQSFTDMHDWGDMLVAAGFAEPVMDMERITLTYENPARLIAELRELGPNLHPARFAGLRGRGWRRRLETAMTDRLAGPDGRLGLTFEIIYGHALKPAPRVKVSEHSAVSLQDMRALLGTGKRQPTDRGRPAEPLEDGGVRPGGER
jgi:malonyl-CoA O-methyltransferase